MAHLEARRGMKGRPEEGVAARFFCILRAPRESARAPDSFSRSLFARSVAFLLKGRSFFVVVSVMRYLRCRVREAFGEPSLAPRDTQ
ncbi:hypothetical protein [Polyangium jinanense]|uniref:Uncharacterized protein n=1 Tax=Polyangium jinanense TaxID=2829994 RepID=A0A9X3XAY7_9BACT|nr:hypothetical protein [Polyangium jinanense]MDC3985413.1 hypothetical protein [Polyangium jinanense]